MAKKKRNPQSKRSHSAIEPVTGVLSEREREILRVVVKSFVETAGPIGSRFVAKNFAIGLSPASIRNTMSDLEERGFLEHPYTSAGRIPTELGYRTFVDQLMESHSLSAADKKVLRAELEQIAGRTEELLLESTRVLGSLSSLLSVVLTPKLSTGVLERLELVKLSSSRMMFVISVKGGLVKTIVLKVDLDIRRSALDEIVSMLNERLVGLSLLEIRETFHERVADLADVTGLVQLTLKESEYLFSELPESDRVLYGNTQGLLTQPEFREPQDLRTLIELIEDKDTVVSVIEDTHFEELTGMGTASISIGSENGLDSNIAKYSIVTAQYTLGQSVGTIGVIGPKRMEYGRVVSLVEGMAKVITAAGAESE